MALHVEGYSREPVFLREKLQGTATIALKEFMAKYSKNIEGFRPGTAEVGSFSCEKEIPANLQDLLISQKNRKRQLYTKHEHLMDTWADSWLQNLLWATSSALTTISSKPFTTAARACNVIE